MDQVMGMLKDKADFSQKYECDTETGKGPFHVTMSKESIEIEFQSRRQLNMDRTVRYGV